MPDDVVPIVDPKLEAIRQALREDASRFDDAVTDLEARPGPTFEGAVIAEPGDLGARVTATTGRRKGWAAATTIEYWKAKGYRVLGLLRWKGGSG